MLGARRPGLSDYPWFCVASSEDEAGAPGLSKPGTSACVEAAVVALTRIVADLASTGRSGKADRASIVPKVSSAMARRAHRPLR